ncbi:MAG: class I SAM-dependent methyltransferase [Planctomycetes bacterium]|nr:class I SAM-dependent methyltransferase [Planctomycetota bacterium]
MTEFVPVHQARSGFVARKARSLVRSRVVDRLSRMQFGSLKLRDVEGDLEFTFGTQAHGAEHVPEVRVRDPRFWTSMAFGGTVGAAESFIRGDWDVDDLGACLALVVRNRHVLEALDRGLARGIQPALHVAHVLRRNTKNGSKRNIAAHYDLGNEFFASWLDPTMTYSSALFDNPQAATFDQLEAAQREKYDRLCRRIALRPGDDVCEIGTGWGGMAIHMAGEYGCRVTTTTISAQQALLARERVRAAGLEDRIRILERDYRDLERSDATNAHGFDAVVSIEMIEAVGHRFLPKFFEACRRVVADHGRVGLQVITIADQFYDQARKQVDFIQSHVFPGSAIPSVGAMVGAMSRATDFRLVETNDFGEHYAATLRIWRERFVAARSKLAALGYDERFRRLWEFYLAYCEAGFAERQLGLHQMVLAPGARSGA